MRPHRFPSRHLVCLGHVWSWPDRCSFPTPSYRICIESNDQYCRSAKNILHQYTDAMKVYELDEMEDGGDIQAYLGEKTGQRTVPSIFIKQQFIGGSESRALTVLTGRQRPPGALGRRHQEAHPGLEASP